MNLEQEELISDQDTDTNDDEVLVEEELNGEQLENDNGVLIEKEIFANDFEIDKQVKLVPLPTTTFPNKKGTILYLHDFTSSYLSHKGFYDRIDLYDYHAINLLNHGLTKPEKSDPTVEDFINLVINYVKENNLQDLILIGHGFGAFIASAAAQNLRSRVDKLVLVSPLHSSILAKNPTLENIFLPTCLEDICVAQKNKLVNFDEFTNDINFQKDLVSELNYLLEKKAIFKTTYDKVYNSDFLKQVDATYLQTKDIPTLLILGNDDNVNDVESIEVFFKDYYKNLKKYVMRNAGYSPFLEQIGFYYFNVLQFLNNSKFSYQKAMEDNQNFTLVSEVEQKEYISIWAKIVAFFKR